jgi:opacity protein-like surface antigen
MKNYKKMIVGVLCAFTLTTSIFAADAVRAGSVVETTAVKSTSLFNAGEVGVSLSSGYNVDRAAAFQQDYTVNVSAGLFYFPTRNLGFEANVPFYQTDGVSVDEVQAGLLLRVPLARTLPVLRNLAPYVGLGGVYNWDAYDKWAYVAKGGLEYRLNSKWGVFVEGQYRNSDFNLDRGQTSVQTGLKLSF